MRQVQAAFGDWAKPATPAPALVIPDVPAPAKAPAPQRHRPAGRPADRLLFGYNGGLSADQPGLLRRPDHELHPRRRHVRLAPGQDHPRPERPGLLGLLVHSTPSTAPAPSRSSSARTPRTPPAPSSLLRQILAQMRQYGVTPDEVAQAKLYLTGEYPLRLETNAGVAGQLLLAEDYGLGLDFSRSGATPSTTPSRPPRSTPPSRSTCTPTRASWSSRARRRSKRQETPNPRPSEPNPPAPFPKKDKEGGGGKEGEGGRGGEGREA